MTADDLNRKISADIAEIKANIKSLREIAERSQGSFEKHVEKDEKVHGQVIRHAVYIGLLWTIFGLAALTVTARNIMAHIGILV